MKIHHFLLASLFLLAFLMPSSQAVEVTVTLQQGLNGYEGCEDARIHSHGYYYGTPGRLCVGDSYTGEYFGNISLIRFKDIASKLGKTTVISAKLYLYLISEIEPEPRNIYAYRALQNWNEDYCDQPDGRLGWSYFNDDKEWNGAGLSVASDHEDEDGSADRGSTEIGSTLADKGKNQWYSIDVTKAVQNWYSGSWKEYGLALIGENAPLSAKEFYDSETPEISFRPKLEIKCNPDIPVANAGKDQYIGVWGKPVLLDGSASFDLNDPLSELIFSWRFLSLPENSALTDENISPNNAKDKAVKASFIPDVWGVYEVELKITNSLGISDKDNVSIYIGNTHPRIWLTPEHLAKLRNNAQRQTSQWIRLKDYVDGGNADIFSICLVYQVTGNPFYADMVINDLIKSGNTVSGNISEAAFCFDWVYDKLSEEQKVALVDHINRRIESDSRSMLNEQWFLWGNKNVDIMLNLALGGMATYGDNPKAQEWIDNANRRFNDLTATELELAGDGGGYPEGTVYGFITVMRILQYAQALKTYENKDIVSKYSWFHDRMAYELLADHPGFSKYGDFRDYPSFGDSERNRYTMADYGRIGRLMLIHQFPDSDIARQLQWYLNQPPANKVAWNGMAANEFLWYDPDQPQIQPTLLAHHAVGTGTIFMRSDWSDEAVYISFQGGDHFAYHQHLDQNSFTIFKEGDLAIESGVYDGDGLSSHDLQYYARTIAHNTMLVYDPAEVFGPFRGGNDALNDGGQRMMYPASVVAYNAQYWRQNKEQYDTADIKKFFDSQELTYICSDATNAYSSSKVSNFTRQLVYLRPDIIIIFDRVASTNPGFPKKCLIHFLSEPLVNGNQIAVSNGEYLYDGDLTVAAADRGRLFIRTLLPENHRIRKVGGRGIKDYYVFGTNYEAEGNEYEDDYGEWRIEVEPSLESKEDIFLNVLYPAKANINTMPASISLEGDNFTGVQIRNSIVMFSKTEAELDKCEFSVSESGLYKACIADLAGNKVYDVYVDSNLIGTFSITDDSLLIFDLQLSGNHLVKISANQSPPGIPGRPMHVENHESE